MPLTFQVWLVVTKLRQAAAALIVVGPGGGGGGGPPPESPPPPPQAARTDAASATTSCCFAIPMRDLRVGRNRCVSRPPNDTHTQVGSSQPETGGAGAGTFLVAGGSAGPAAA